MKKNPHHINRESFTAAGIRTGCLETAETLAVVQGPSLSVTVHNHHADELLPVASLPPAARNRRAALLPDAPERRLAQTAPPSLCMQAPRGVSEGDFI